MDADLDVTQRMVLAGMRTILDLIQGGEVADGRKFQLLEWHCRVYEVPKEHFDRLAACLGFHYHRPWDAYLDRKGLEGARDLDRIAEGLSAGGACWKGRGFH